MKKLLSMILLIGTMGIIQSQEDNFKVSFLNHSKIKEQLVEIKDFFQANDDKFNFSDLLANKEIFIAICRDKVSNKICGIILFEPKNKDKYQSGNIDEASVTFIMSNLNNLLIDKKYKTHFKIKTQILSLMLEPIEKFCKQNKIKKLFISASGFSDSTKKIFFKAGFHEPLADKIGSKFFYTPSWLEKKI